MEGNAVDVAGDSVRPSADQIRGQLEKILSSRGFVRSERLRRFLRFTVAKTLSRDLDQISEQVLGREVFDRKDGYDPQIDSIVRVEARRLRHKLHEYYQGPGVNDPVQIVLQKGSYVPAFRYTAPSAPAGKTGLDVRTVAV